MNRKILWMVVILTLLLSSCDQITPTATPTPQISMTEVVATEIPASPTPDDNLVTLKIYLLDYTPETIKWLEETINPVFENTHPDVGVEIIQGSWLDWEKVYNGYFTANEGPDIITLASEMNTLYGQKLTDLEPYLGEAAWPEIDNFGPSLENARFDGKLRGLPLFTAARFIFCRTDIMEASGWTTGTPGDFAEWIDFAKKGTKIDPASKTIVQQAFVPFDANSMADWQWWLTVFYSLGGRLYKDDGMPNFDSPEALAATQFILDMRHATYGYASSSVNPLPILQGSVIDTNDETGLDNGVICLANSGWAAPALDRNVWDKISIDAFAGDPINFPNSRPVVLSFNDWLAVPEYSTNKELAADWLKIVFSKEANNRWNETLGLIPARIDSQFGFINENVQLQREAELATQYGIGFAGIVEPSKLAVIMQDALNKLVTEEMTPEDTTAKIQSDYETVLEKTP